MPYDEPEITGGQADNNSVEVEASATVVEGGESAPPPVASGSSDVAEGEIPRDVRQMAMFCHLLGLANYVVPFGGIIGPLVLWQMKRADHPFIDEQGRSALNFNLTAGIAMLCCIPLVFFLVGIPLIALISVAANVFAIIAGIAANEGRSYEYPFKIDFVGSD
jgi:uncharacterized Tic20 family protein